MLKIDRCHLATNEFQINQSVYFNSRLTAHFRHIRVHYSLHARITSCRNYDRHLCLQSYKQNQKAK